MTLIERETIARTYKASGKEKLELVLQMASPDTLMEVATSVILVSLMVFPIQRPAQEPTSRTVLSSTAESGPMVLNSTRANLM